MIIKTDKDQLLNYLKDASNTEGYCDAVYLPESVDEIKQIFKEAEQKKINVTVSGNRTGLTGAAVPLGGFVVSMEKLNKIIELDINNKYVTVEPGVILSDLLNEVKGHNLYFPPDPTELNCFIGGIVATNASGAKSFKYGATRNFVLSLDVLLSSGELIKLNRGESFASDNKLRLKTDTGRLINLELPNLKMPTTKNAAGFYCTENMDAIDLFIGSEGTLGIFSRIKLKVLNYPERLFSAVIFFDKKENALNFVEMVRDESRVPENKKTKNLIDALAIEFFDKNSLSFLKNEYNLIPPDADAAVWIQQETTSKTEENVYESYINLISICDGNLNNSWIAISDKDRKSIELFRHSISAKVNEYISSNNFKKLGTDIAVPENELKNFYKNLSYKVAKEKLDYVTYGHFGDSHIHLNMLPKNEKEYEKAKKLYGQFCEDAIKLGGTFSAEHGVGKNKKEYLIRMYGTDEIKKMIEIKKRLDTNLILGIGNVFDI